MVVHVTTHHHTVEINDLSLKVLYVANKAKQLQKMQNEAKDVSNKWRRSEGRTGRLKRRVVGRDG